MSDREEVPICLCEQYWPGEGHHDECPVFREIVRLREQLALVKVALPHIKEAAWMLHRASKTNLNFTRSLGDSANILNEHIERIEEAFEEKDM